MKRGVYNTKRWLLEEDVVGILAESLAEYDGNTEARKAIEQTITWMDLEEEVKDYTETKL